MSNNNDRIDREEIEDYQEQSREFMAKSYVYLTAGDLHQASEKGWGAASHMAKAVAVAQGWQYDSHSGFNEVMFQASQMSGNPRIHVIRGIANDLHVNYYRRKRHLNAQEIEASLGYIAELINLLAPLTNPTPGA